MPFKNTKMSTLPLAFALNLNYFFILDNVCHELQIKTT